MEVELQLVAFKLSVSMPADFMILFNQWPIVAGLTGLWGLRTEINSAFCGVLLLLVRSFSDLLS